MIERKVVLHAARNHGLGFLNHRLGSHALLLVVFVFVFLRASGETE